MLGSVLGAGAAGFLGIASWCACASLLVALVWAAVVLLSSETARHGARPRPTSPSDVCTFDMLIFYYDDDDELQCECVDDSEDDEWSLARGLM